MAKESGDLATKVEDIDKRLALLEHQFRGPARAQTTSGLAPIGPQGVISRLIALERDVRDLRQAVKAIQGELKKITRRS